MKKTLRKFIVIAVTGTPGTGKTTIAKCIAKQGMMKYLDVKKLIKQEQLGEWYDKKRHCIVVDEQKLAKRLIRSISEQQKKKQYSGVVVDSHLSHYIPHRFVDYCIVTKCDLKVLNQRLLKRRYSKSKVRENLDAEIFDVCRQEALEAGHRVVAIDATKPPVWKKQIAEFLRKIQVK